MKKIFCLLFMMEVLVFSSCNRDEVISTELPPEIILDSKTGIYTTKAGRAITIAPTYKHAEEAVYSWMSAGKVLGTEPSYEFIAEQEGQVYITLSVKTEYGADEEEIRVDVLALEIPNVSLAGAENGFMILSGEQILFTPVVADCSIETSYSWKVDGVEVSKELSYAFSSDEIRSYELEFSASNEDGSDAVKFMVSVVSQEDMPMTWKFDRTEYNISSGRSILLAPVEVGSTDGVTYQWSVDGVDVEGADQVSFVFDIAKEGKYNVAVTASKMMSEGVFSTNQNLVVNVCAVEGTYYRAKSGGSSADWNRVYEYRPAPGQFINELKTGGFTGENTMDAAIAYAEKRMESGTWVSLGGFGGYIVVGFDHSIENSGDYDFAIKGNSFDGSSEPGIVWVMQDENGDGLPNDTWYELKGSETGVSTTIQNYAVTYYRPSAPGMPVQWTDNQGKTGEIDYLKQFHTQEYYYPLWIAEDTYTLRGTCLEPRNHDESGNGSYWVQEAYDWGYADNFSPVDRLTDEENAGAAANPNHFKISHAIGFDGNPVQLKYIDFIKVQTGVNGKGGITGELSTEIINIQDYNMIKQQ